jgi:pyridoxamine 5'-phosphate oxidase
LVPIFENACVDQLPTVPRREYKRGTLARNDLDPDPIKQFAVWFNEAIEAQSLDAHGMTLATADRSGQPSARIVLLKKFDQRGFVFCTNYSSRKGKEIAENPQASLLFYWSLLERQVQISGTISKIPREESVKYFNERPELARLAALASRQSEVLPGREVLENRFTELVKQYKGKEIPMPQNWGGYLLEPRTIEFWQGGVNRLHDRFEYRRTSGPWVLQRLSP